MCYMDKIQDDCDLASKSEMPFLIIGAISCLPTVKGLTEGYLNHGNLHPLDKGEEKDHPSVMPMDLSETCFSAQ